MSSIGAILGTAAVAVGRGAAAAVGDGLSFAGELLRVVGGEATQPPTADEPATNPFTDRIDALRQRIRRMLAAAGIELSQPAELTSDGLGGIAVAGAHPQQAAIESVLGSDVLLESDFHQLASEIAESNGTSDLGSALSIAVQP